MAQHDYVISNQSAAGMRADWNNALAAIVSQNSGANEPNPTYAYQWWADTTAGVLKLRNAANNAWISLLQLDGTSFLVPPADGSITTAKLADSALAASTAGLAKMADGYLTANAAGRAKMADDFIITAKLAAAVRERLQPAGIIAFYPATVAPAGWLKANGAAVTRSVYTDLWAYAQASGNLAASEGAKAAGQFGPGNGTSTFSLPDYRGEFLRGWDDGRGVDSGRTLGSAQAHAIQSHNHSGVVGVGVNGSVGTTGGIIGVQSDGINTAIGNTGGTETRPRNIALLACIKF